MARLLLTESRYLFENVREFRNNNNNYLLSQQPLSIMIVII